ncbi:MAG: UDP-N-acetylmuramate--alanine ligase [Pseudomonadota bacterium]|jgi:UDP-N-acetylmuramate--alanine ligase
MVAGLKPPPPKKIKCHFIGIGGSGMSGLAEYALGMGWDVTGSDVADNDSLRRIELLGAKVFLDHGATNLGDIDEVIVSSAIKPDNPELLEARARGIPVLHRSDFLARLMRGANSVTVAGTHGKTTTTALITHVLTSCGAAPGAVVGGVMLDVHSSTRVGDGRFFVAEADESDGTFLKYEPTLAVLTNVDRDHLDFYGSFENIKAAFHDYLKTSDPDAGVVCCWDDPVVREVSEGINRPRLTYGFLLGCEVRAIDIQTRGFETTFTAVVERDRLRCKLPLAGRHNVLNALAGLSVARAFGLDVRIAAQSLETFAGVSRRMEVVVDDEQVKVIDDYAHNPGKIQACIAAVRSAWPSHHITVIHQPHRYSRLETMYDLTVSSFRGATNVILLPVYAAGESPVSTPDLAGLAKDISLASSTNAVLCSDKSEASRMALQLSSRPAIILTVGAGDVWKVANILRENLVG